MTGMWTQDKYVTIPRTDWLQNHSSELLNVKQDG